MGQNSDSSSLSDSRILQIEAEVEQAAADHLNAKDATTALSHYAEDVIAVSNTTILPSRETLAKDVTAYYDILKTVNLAVWDEMHIRVIDRDVAFVTAKFRYSFTDTSNESTGLEGVWTALFVLRDDGWKIRLRHESFVPADQII